jgi:replicative DNA helicase
VSDETVADVTAEQGVLGAMILDNMVIADMASLLRAADFYRPHHADLFDLMIDMFGKGIPVDELTVLSRLSETGDITRVGGAPYIASLTQYANPMSATFYARAVADRATVRRIAELGMAAQQLAQQPGDTADKVAMVRQLADDLGEHRETTTGVWVGDVTLAAIDAIDAAGRPDAAAALLRTGYRDLDRLLGGGLRPGQLIVVAARPGVGKSTALLDLHRSISLTQAVPSAMISLEMPTEEIMQRLLSAETGIPLAHIRTGQLRPEQEQQLADRIPHVMDKPLKLVDAPSASLPFIRAEGRRMVVRDGIRMLGVDYLQLMATPPKSENRQQAVADFSRGLKLFARENAVPVVACAQLNRNPEQRRDKTPGLSDLRESGAIEQDADVVILLHDPTGGEPDHPRAGEFDLIVAKHRGGPTGVITVTQQLHRARFADMQIV